MAFTGPMEDRLAIRELLENYADAVFRADGENWAMLWAEEGVWELMGSEIHGRKSIQATWQKLMSGLSMAAFFSNPGALSIMGDQAMGRCYTTEVLQEKSGSTRRIIGVYEDSFVKRDGNWLFARRKYRVLLSETA